MGQIDPTPSASYSAALKAILDDRLILSLPAAVLETAAKRAFAAGLSPCEAAIRICHEHARLVSRNLIEQELIASDLAELTIASRIDECAELAHSMEQDIVDLLPDLSDLVQQPCFSDEFRRMVSNIATWHGIPEHRWNTADLLKSLSRRATV